MERIGEVNQAEFQAKMLASLDDLREIKTDVKELQRTVGAWPGICGDHRIELERRTENGVRRATGKTVWVVLAVVVPILILAAGAILTLS